MRQITARAPAKLNLTLDVLSLRPDGYHEIASIMQTVDRYDTVTVSAAPAGITLTCDGPMPCPPQKNTAYRAAQLFLQHHGISSGISIALHKTIPQQAGMGGGSADAAAVLLALDRLFGTALPMPQLVALGAAVGADVPFCLVGGTALVTGIGEQIVPLPALPAVTFSVAQPADGISTAEAYRAVDAAIPAARPDHGAAQAALHSGDLSALLPQMINVFEPATALHGVAEIRTAMYASGAAVSRMTGSGSAVFGLFTDSAAADRCTAQLAGRWPTAFTCRPCSGPLLNETIV